MRLSFQVPFVQQQSWLEDFPIPHLLASCYISPKCLKLLWRANNSSNFPGHWPIIHSLTALGLPQPENRSSRAAPHMSAGSVVKTREITDSMSKLLLIFSGWFGCIWSTATLFSGFLPTHSCLLPDSLSGFSKSVPRPEGSTSHHVIIRLLFSPWHHCLAYRENKEPVLDGKQIVQLLGIPDGHLREIKGAFSRHYKNPPMGNLGVWVFLQQWLWMSLKTDAHTCS